MEKAADFHKAFKVINDVFLVCDWSADFKKLVSQSGKGRPAVAAHSAQPKCAVLSYLTARRCFGTWSGDSIRSPLVNHDALRLGFQISEMSEVGNWQIRNSNKL